MAHIDVLEVHLARNKIRAKSLFNAIELLRSSSCQLDRRRVKSPFVQILGARRTTVTLAAGTLHHAGLIDDSRVHVTIKKRAGLEGATCECYGVVGKEFQRLGLL